MRNACPPHLPAAAAAIALKKEKEKVFRGSRRGRRRIDMSDVKLVSVRGEANRVRENEQEGEEEEGEEEEGGKKKQQNWTYRQTRTRLTTTK